MSTVRGMPSIGEHDLFEMRYLAELWRQLVPYGIRIDYSADRAALDGGLHLYRRGAGPGGQVGDVRIWFQCKGIRDTTLSAADLEKRDQVSVAGISVDHLQFWYSSAEPVYLVVYLEAMDDFVAADVRQLIDLSGGWVLFGDLRRKGQATLTLQIPRRDSRARDYCDAVAPQSPDRRPAFSWAPTWASLRPAAERASPAPAGCFRRTDRPSARRARVSRRSAA
jgi:hypothetical protein